MQGELLDFLLICIEVCTGSCLISFSFAFKSFFVLWNIRLICRRINPIKLICVVQSSPWKQTSKRLQIGNKNDGYYLMFRYRNYNRVCYQFVFRFEWYQITITLNIFLEILSLIMTTYHLAQVWGKKENKPSKFFYNAAISGVQIYSVEIP